MQAERVHPCAVRSCTGWPGRNQEIEVCQLLTRAEAVYCGRAHCRVPHYLPRQRG